MFTNNLFTRVKNRYLDAAIKFVLFSATVHLILITIYVITHIGVVSLNYFDILDVDLFIPALKNGLASQLISLVFAILFYTLILKYFTKRQ